MHGEGEPVRRLLSSSESNSLQIIGSEISSAIKWFQPLPDRNYEGSGIATTRDQGSQLRKIRIESWSSLLNWVSFTIEPTNYWLSLFFLVVAGCDFFCWRCISLCRHLFCCLVPWSVCLEFMTVCINLFWQQNNFCASVVLIYFSLLKKIVRQNWIILCNTRNILFNFKCEHRSIVFLLWKYVVYNALSIIYYFLPSIVFLFWECVVYNALSITPFGA